MAYDLTTRAARRKLSPRIRAPYYAKVGGASLGFRCTGPDGEGTWIGRLSENGKYVFQALGRFDDYRDAVSALQQWLAEHEQRRRGGAGVAAKNMTVADACRVYLDDFKKRKGDARPYRYALNMLEARVIGRQPSKRKVAVDPTPIAGIRLNDLSKRHFKEWREGLLPCDEAQASRPQRATANRHFKALAAVLNHARQEGFALSDAAWQGVRGFPDVQASADESHRYLTREERQRIIEACDPSVQDFVALLAVIGARPIELRRAVVGDFNVRTKELLLWSNKGGEGKRRERKVPLDALLGALVIVQRIVRDKLPTAPLFAFRDENDYLLPFKDAVRKVELPEDVTAYSLRHSFITDAIAAGVATLTVARIVGTSIGQIDRTYGKTVAEHAKEAFARMKVI